MIQWWWLIVAGFAGAVVSVVLYGIVTFLKTAWRVLKGFEASLNASVEVAQNLNNSLQWMKQLSSVFNPPQPQVDEETGEPYQQPEQRPRTVVPFPEPELSRFRSAPVEPPKDATKEDAEVMAPSDSQMAEEERLENAREAGIDVDGPLERPVGREVDSL